MHQIVIIYQCNAETDTGYINDIKNVHPETSGWRHIHWSTSPLGWRNHVFPEWCWRISFLKWSFSYSSTFIIGLEPDLLEGEKPIRFLFDLRRLYINYVPFGFMSLAERFTSILTHYTAYVRKPRVGVIATAASYCQWAQGGSRNSTGSSLFLCNKGRKHQLHCLLVTVLT